MTTPSTQAQPAGVSTAVTTIVLTQYVTQEAASIKISSTPVAVVQPTDDASFKTVLSPRPTSQTPFDLDVSSTALSVAPGSITQALGETGSVGSSTAPATSIGIDKKLVIIGGLSGAVGGLLLLGLLLFFYLRRRHQRREGMQEDKAPVDEYVARPSINSSSSRFSNEPTDQTTFIQEHTTYPPATIDGNLIRMSLDRFERPFVKKEGWRDSNGPGRLRVVNPDRSCPSTPELPSVRAPQSHLQLYPPFAPAFLSSIRSKSASYSSTPGVSCLPHVPGNSHAPSDHSMTTTATPSFRSYPSLVSLRTAVHQIPKDPFVTLPSNNPQQRANRPSLAPLQSTTSRTWSSLGRVLLPFKTKSPPMVQSARSSARESLLFYSPTRPSHRSSVRSDLLTLDRPSFGGRSTDASVHVSERDSDKRYTQSSMIYDGT